MIQSIGISIAPPFATIDDAICGGFFGQFRHRTSKTFYLKKERQGHHNDGNSLNLELMME